MELAHKLDANYKLNKVRAGIAKGYTQLTPLT